jgi:hypothetical protein
MSSFPAAFGRDYLHGIAAPQLSQGMLARRTLGGRPVDIKRWSGAGQ